MMNKLYTLYLTAYFFTFLFGNNSSIPFREAPQIPGLNPSPAQSILNNNQFQMNHQFSLSTSMGDGFGSTTGIYSNYTHYSFSERLKLKTGLHLFQNQNNFNISSDPQTGIGYELGLEYKLGENSLVQFQLVNFKNSPLLYRRYPAVNVP